MPMSPTTAQPIIEQFMVPVGPLGTEDPPLGWPDGATPPPPPIEGVTGSEGGGSFSFSSTTPLTPGALVGGFAAVPPFWAGAEIVGNTASTVDVAIPISHPDGPTTEDITASSDNQDTFTVSGPIGSVQSVSRIGDGALIAVDDEASAPLLADGKVAVGVADPPIQTGDTIRIVFTPPFAGPPPAGTAFTIAQPKDPVEGLTTGDAWASAYRTLFEAGSSNGVSPIGVLLEPAEAAMKAVIDVMMSVPGLAPVALQAGALAFWGVVATSAAAIFPGAISAVPPAGLLGLGALVTAAGVSAMALPVSDPWTPASSQAAAALFSTALYTASLGGLIVFPGPAAFPFL